MTLLGPRLPRSQLQLKQFDQGKSFTLPAPTGGLNLRNDIGDLKPIEARYLDNWLSTDGFVSIRPGKTRHAGGMGLGEVKTLAAFVGYSTTALLAGANGKIYDVTNQTYSGTPGSPYDNDSYTKILLSFDGADASTTITDTNAGGSSHTWTAVANAQIDTAQSKFGGSSLLLDGVGDYIDTADHADFTVGSGDWTVDFQFNCTAATGLTRRIFGQCDNLGTAATRAIEMVRDTTGIMVARVFYGGSFVNINGTTIFSDVTNTGWHHLALVRTGNTMRMFVDGIQESSDVDMTGVTVNNSANRFAVGRLGELAGNEWAGWVDEFRFSVGIARWTSAFTPPSTAYAARLMASGFGQDRWQTALYSDRLFFVNGTDTPQVYNGSTVAAIAWAAVGLTNTNLVNIALVRNRLWFCESSQAWAWYGAVGQITAASNLTKFQLEQIAGGGYLMAVGAWSRDGGDGANALTVFVMSTGEVIIYQGDPATTFSLIGKYHGAPPIGRRCLFNVGGELMVITTQGMLPLSSAIGGTVTAQDIAAIDPWGKIAPGIASDATADSGNAGWHGIFDRGLVYVNVPQETGSQSRQWVLNTRTGAWMSYSGINASSFCTFNGVTYMGMMTGGDVMTLNGDSDDGTEIVARANCAYVYPTKAQYANMFTAARPKLKCGGTVSGLIGVDTDFNQTVATGDYLAFSSTSSSGAWDTSPWDTTSWATDPEVVQKWYSIKGSGRAVSVRFLISSLTSAVEWYATDLLYKPGGIR